MPKVAKAAHRKYGQTIAEAFPWLLETVKRGIPARHAEAMAGFPKDAIHAYCADHPEAREMLDQAAAEGDEHLVKGLYEAALEDPKFGLLLLERRRPDEWGKIERVEHSGGVNLKQPTRAEAFAELAEAAKKDPAVREALAAALGLAG